MSSEKKNAKSLIDKFLSLVENVGNKLPHPTALFALFAFGVVILSWFVSLFDLQVIHPERERQLSLSVY
jgi:aminobenzoyl-glutamate transport protein